MMHQWMYLKQVSFLFSHQQFIGKDIKNIDIQKSISSLYTAIHYLFHKKLTSPSRSLMLQLPLTVVHLRNYVLCVSHLLVPAELEDNNDMVDFVSQMILP